MNGRVSNIKAVIVATILTTIVLFVFYGNILSDLGKPMGNLMDAAKNYYTVQYHVLHDSSAWHFEGMNYPYGEHVIFTDNQPFLANALKLINNIIPIGNDLIFILNFLMLLSFVGCAAILALIMRHFEVGWLYAGVAAGLIAMLSPQIMRIAGHFALAYSVFIPLLWYLWLQYFRSRKQVISIVIGGVMLIFTFIHVYYLAIGLFFGLALWLCSYMGGVKINGKSLLNLFIQFILPLLLFQGWMMLTDGIEDRHAQPWGFLAYIAKWEGVFLPTNLPLGNFISENIAGIRPIGYESRTYAGFSVTLFFLLMIGILAASIFYRKASNWLQLERPLAISFIAGILVLIFALGIPFIFGLEDLLHYTGPLKQFRSTGRFAWVFFYTANVTAFVWFFRRWHESSKRWLKILILVIPFSFLITDVYMLNNDVQNSLVSVDAPVFKTAVIDEKQYQAIMPLPYYHLGSETPGISIRCNILNSSMQASLQTGLPLTSVNMSRTSLRQTDAQIALLNQSPEAERILSLYKSKKPLLLMVEKDCELNPSEDNWVTKGEYIGSAGKYKYYSLPIETMRNTIQE